MNQQDSINLDINLMSLGYSLEQLMEIAGQGVARCIVDFLLKNLGNYISSSSISSEKRSIVFIIGPGNNGGDGLVAARYLSLFLDSVLDVEEAKVNQNNHLQMDIKVYLVEEEKVKNKFSPLLALLDAFEIPLVQNRKSLEEGEWDFVVDCVFGFSFKHPLRGPYVDIIKWMVQRSKTASLISVDVPSGWDVEKGPITSSRPADQSESEETTLYPAAIISLTAPKLCVSQSCFKGSHYVTGRFIPPSLSRKFNLDLPRYAVGALFVQLQ